MNLNEVKLYGRLGKDPETKGKACMFSLATKEVWKDKEGQKQERTEWHNCVAFGVPGELIAKYSKKGNTLYVSGSIQYKEHEGKRYTSIVVDKFQFGDGNSKEGKSESNDDLPF